MSLIEGARVAYVGDGEEGLAIGDLGKILLRDGNSSHVKWLSGRRTGEIMLVSDFDLSAPSQELPYEDFDSGPLVSVSVHAVLNRYGVEGLYEALSEEGHMTIFEPVIDEAIGIIGARIRNDPSFREVLSDLNPDEGEEFVTFATYALLRDALLEDQ